MGLKNIFPPKKKIIKRMKEKVDALYYLKQYNAIEDESRMREFREELCAECGWGRSTFYNRIKDGCLKPVEQKAFIRIIRLYLNKI